MNLAGGNDGVVRNGTPWGGGEVAYVRRDSFWIEHDGRLDAEGGTAAQSTAPIFVADSNQGVERRELTHDGARLVDGPDLPSRGWGPLSAQRVLALTALAFALGIAVSPLVRSPRPSAPAAVIATPTPPATATPPATPTPPAVPPATTVASTVPPSPAPPPVGSAVDGADGATMAPVAHASARSSARNRSTSGLGATLSSRQSQKKAPPSDEKVPLAPEATASPDAADLSTTKSSDKPHDVAPSKTKDNQGPSTAPKKPAAKAWVDPWAGDVAAARVG